MKSSLQKLEKFLRLEINRQYDNQAVFGGLESILASWESEAHADLVGEKILIALVREISKYDGLSIAERSTSVKKMLSLIDEGPRRVSDKREESKSPTISEDSLKSTKRKKKKSLTKIQQETIPAALGASVTVLDGVGPKNAERLQKLGIYSLEDMLYHLPRRHEDFSQLLPISQVKYGQNVTISGRVTGKSKRVVGKRKLKIFELVVEDDSAALRASWMNQPWKTKNIQEEDQVLLSGSIDQYLGRLTMSNPEMELLDSEQLHTNRIVPIYPLTANIGQRWLRTIMKKVISYWAPRVEDPVPGSILKSYEFIDLAQALYQVHFPDSWEELEAAQARIAFNELFIMQLAVLQQKSRWKSSKARIFKVSQDWLDQQYANLPFELTKAQKGSWHDFMKDMASGQPMNRLLQGDVGSGKTVIAALAMAAIANEGAQSAIMAPTSILAEQHYASLRKLLLHTDSSLHENEIALLIGATSAAERKEIKAALRSGEIKILIGTHTLIEDPILFAELELIVIDEQHRFGVQQRAALRSKGNNPHLLVMTATPIPRSLALTLFGDLDLSVIDELPPGRKEISTHILLPRERKRAYNLIHSEIGKGRQAFILYPLVEGNDKNPDKAAVEQHQELQKNIFSNYRLTLMHGRLKAEVKEQSMADFRDHKSDILVSTSVIEVGLDIPNASVMLIEGANRFGLAQLHQFRGRVGRGADKSYCILIPDNEDAAENERLKAMVESNDGFILAERDLQQRGPGEFLGKNQSGFAGLRFASLADSRMIDRARRAAASLLEQDPQLQAAEHKHLANILHSYWSEGKGDVS